MNANGPLTVNPGTKREASQKQNPLTMKENSPKVKKLMGIDKTERVGRITALMTPTATAANIAAGKLAISTLGTIKSTISNPNAVAIVVIENPMTFILLPPKLNVFGCAGIDESYF